MDDNGPSISIIIPCLNQYDELETCLNAVANLDYPTYNLQTIVIDNGSLIALDDSLQQKFPFVEWLNYSETQNPYSCRNLGIKSAQCDWIALLDAKCKPSAHWLKAAVRSIDTGSDLVAGRFDFLYPDDTLSSKVHGILYLLNERNYRAKSGFPTGNIIVRRSLFSELGLFAEELPTGNDIIWSRKAINNGAQISYNPDMVVRYEAKSYHQLRHSMSKYARGVAGNNTVISIVLSIIRSTLPMWPHHFISAVSERQLSLGFLATIRLYIKVWQAKVYFGMQLAKAALSDK